MSSSIKNCVFEDIISAFTGGNRFLGFRLLKCTLKNLNKYEMNNDSIFYFFCHCNQKNTGVRQKKTKQVPLHLWPFISFPIFSLWPLFSVWRLNVCHIWQTVMPPCPLTPAAGSVKSSPSPSHSAALLVFFFVFFISLYRSNSLCQFVFLSHSHKYLFVLAASLLTHISPLLSPELRPQGLWCPVCGAGYSSFGLLSKPTKLRSHWPRGSCRVCNHPA